MSPNDTCHSCEQPLPAEGAFCSQCGSEVPGAARAAAEQRDTLEPTQIGQAQCLSCNAPHADGDIFCRFCGARADEATASSSPVSNGPDRIKERLASATGGEFEIIKRLGRGGMGSVYLARESSLQRFVAIKVLAPELVADETLLERFRTEARTVATLRHRSIVAIHAVRDTGDLHYFVMDYVEGASLGDVIRFHGPLPPPVVKAVLYDVGGALTHAHQQGSGIVHRDIKPVNIMLDSHGEVVVMDFGISKAAGARSGLTLVGSIVGTPEYMSPEQCRGDVLTVASDQYSLGLLGYSMLAGAPPFSGPHWAVIASQIEEAPPSIGEIRPDCPRDLADSIHRMLAKVPGERWPSVQDAVRAFGGEYHERGDPVREQIARLAEESHGATWVEVPVSRLELEPLAEAVEPGDTLNLRAEAFDDLGRVLSGRAITWSTSAPRIFAISPDGEGNAVSEGLALVMARHGDTEASAEIVVSRPAVSKIQLQQPPRDLEMGIAFSLAARILDKNDRVLEGRSIRWSTTDPRIAEVTPEGSIRTMGPGVVSLVAECEGTSTAIDLVVSPASAMDDPAGARARVPVPPEGSATATAARTRWSHRFSIRVWLLLIAVPLGATASAIAIGRDTGQVPTQGSQGADVEGAESPAPQEVTPVGISPSTDTSPGGEPLDAVAGDPATATGPAPISSPVSDFVVAAAPVSGPQLASISVVGVGSPLSEGEIRVYSVGTLDDSGQPLPFLPSALVWSSSDSSVLTVSASGVATAAGGGSAWLTAELGDARDSVLVTVRASVAAVRIDGAPQEPVTAGTRMRLSARAEDGRNRPLTRAISWRSTNPAVVTVDPETGDLAAHATGDAIVVASIDGVSDSAFVTVLPPPDEGPSESDLQGAALRYVQLVRSGDTGQVRSLMGPEDEDGDRPHERLLELMGNARLQLEVGDPGPPDVVPPGGGTDAMIQFSVLLSWRGNFGPRRESEVVFEAVLRPANGAWRLVSCRLIEGTEL